ncbi:MAG: hypothetical protein K2H46_00590, partial [Muribaculaceae bacterium]|nr:hypothetical protein [Muribaculaceae bacterium]
AGLEPARLAPLVFETNASTNSAIRASKRGNVGHFPLLRCKGSAIFFNAQFFKLFLSKFIYS